MSERVVKLEQAEIRVPLQIKEEEELLQVKKEEEDATE